MFSRSAYKKLKKLCVKLQKEIKREFCNYLNFKSATDYKLLWKSERITLVEKEKDISENSKLVQILNEHFGNVIKNLGITKIIHDRFNEGLIIANYKNRPGTTKIKENMVSTKNVYLIM